MYRVLVAGSKRLFMEALGELIDAVEGWSADVRLVTGDPSSDSAFGVDAVLIDAEAASHHPEWAKAVRSDWPDADFVVLCRRADSDSVKSLPDLGSIGVVSCEYSPSELVDALAQARENHRVGPAGPPPGREMAALRDPGGLTSRQVEIVRHLAVGRRNAEIAECLGISPNTLRTHVNNMMLRLGVHTRLELVSVARRAGLLDPPLERTV